jgi:hypothetical protein
VESSALQPSASAWPSQWQTDRASLAVENIDSHDPSALRFQFHPNRGKLSSATIREAY